MSLEATGLTKTFGAQRVVDGVDLAVPKGGLTALLGPSGSGKTTLLRLFAGLETLDDDCAGRILLHGEDVTSLPPGRRRIGFVFQHYALFRHMTVLENVAFGLRVRKRSERPADAAIVARARELLQLVQLDGLEARYPQQLSGGQRQRVALARALAPEPRILLLDEPFGALDAKVRKELRRWLREFHDKIGLTTIFVTHDQEEALELADEVVVMNSAKIEQVGRAAEVYDSPASHFVLDFLGGSNRLADAQGTFYVRPLDVLVDARAGASWPAAVVRQALACGPISRLMLSLDATGELVEADIPRSDAAPCPTVGTTVHLKWRKVHRFPGQGSSVRIGSIPLAT